MEVFGNEVEVELQLAAAKVSKICPGLTLLAA